jgi:ABC-type dipeptide/oligopeptide/nickel transport system permease subunit
MKDRTRSTWRRLKRNKGALFGIVIIILAVFIAIFAHLISPDPSPNANRMIVEIDGQKPGFFATVF